MRAFCTPKRNYALTPLRPGSKLPSQRNPLPSGRGITDITFMCPAEGQGPEQSCPIVWTPPSGGAQIAFLHAPVCASFGAMSNLVSYLLPPAKKRLFPRSPFLFLNTVKFVKLTRRFP